MEKRMEWVTKQKMLILPYGVLLTRLFKFVVNENLDLYNETYVLYDRVMNPLSAQLERKTIKDCGTRRGRDSTTSSTFDQLSSSHLNDDDDDDDGNNEGTSPASTPSPIHLISSDLISSSHLLSINCKRRTFVFAKKELVDIVKYRVGYSGSGIGRRDLESLEARIVVHQKNEAVFEEDIAFLKYDVKTGLSYDSQLTERDLSNKSDVFESAFDSSMIESEEDNNQENDRYKAGEGYHAVPPPYTGKFMPPRPDLSFAGLDDFVFKFAISKTITSVHETETSTSKTSKDIIEKPKTVRSSAPIIEH
nr:pentatricopeptide repeat-containing protein [Tanacetum cinerariifolium]